MIDHRPMKSGRFGNLPAKRPCIECPLRRGAKPGALGGCTAQQYLEVLHGPADLACHLSKGFPHDLENMRSCTGVAIYRANLGLRPEGANALEAVLHVDPDPDEVFTHPVTFFVHHTRKP